MLQVTSAVASIIPISTISTTLSSSSSSLSLSSSSSSSFSSDFSSAAVRYIVQSPYTEPEHQLDLSTLDHEAALVARALTRLRAVRADYATAPYGDSFNWAEVAEELRGLVVGSNDNNYDDNDDDKEKDKDKYKDNSRRGFRETTFYVVAFRSQIPLETNMEELGLLDKPAHAEAIASGGFLKYWFGTPDAEGRNLATCIWRTREDAVQGSRGQWHKKAARATASLYSYWKIDRIRMTVRADAVAIEFVEWTE